MIILSLFALGILRSLTLLCFFLEINNREIVIQHGLAKERPSLNYMSSALLTQSRRSLRAGIVGIRDFVIGHNTNVGHVAKKAHWYVFFHSLCICIFHVAVFVRAYSRDTHSCFAAPPKADYRAARCSQYCMLLLRGHVMFYQAFALPPSPYCSGGAPAAATALRPV